jgi:transglutaminase/protease-like cytokinesis protein 3
MRHIPYDLVMILAWLTLIVWAYTVLFRKELHLCRHQHQNIHLEELSEIFEIYAEVENSIELVPFHKNMKINGFLIKRKNT